MIELSTPLRDETILALKVGQAVSVSGTMITARDAAHKWLVDTFIRKTRQPQENDLQVYEELKELLPGSILYHCGPVVAGLDTKEYRFVAAGPTTSIREEPYQSEVMTHFNLKVVVGKGGMGPKTLQGCQAGPFIYLHAIGGAASYIARTVTRVRKVFKLEFGVPEAMWVIDVQDFPAVVTMDAHGASLHAVVAADSRKVLDSLLAKG